MKHIFVIDDTGAPGNKSESRTLKSDRKTYVAVFIEYEYRKILENGITEILDKYRNLGFHLSELHFTDIVNRRRDFKKFNSDLVIGILSDVVSLFNKCHFNVFVQTMTKRTLKENGLNPEKYAKESLDETVLQFLFKRMKLFIERENIRNNFEIFIDEGLMRNGEVMNIEELRSVSSSNYIQFKSSVNSILLQVADFFAYTVNRNQMLMIKDRRTDFDIKVLSLLNSVLSENHISGLRSQAISSSDFTKNDYDDYFESVLKEMGIYEYWKRSNS